MEENALLLADGADLRDRLHGPDLVVREHDRDQDRLLGDRVPNLLRGDAAVLIDVEVRDAEALSLQPLAGVEHRLVLGARGDDVVALLPVELGHALDGEVVRLGRAGGEDDLLLASADQAGDLLARLFDRFLRFPAEGVAAAGGIAEVGGEVGHHRLEHARVERRGGVVVHVDGELQHARSLGVPNVDRMSLL